MVDNKEFISGPEELDTRLSDLISKRLAHSNVVESTFHPSGLFEVAPRKDNIFFSRNDRWFLWNRALVGRHSIEGHIHTNWDGGLILVGNPDFDQRKRVVITQIDRRSTRRVDPRWLDQEEKVPLRRMVINNKGYVIPLTDTFVGADLVTPFDYERILRGELEVHEPVFNVIVPRKFSHLNVWQVDFARPTDASRGIKQDELNVPKPDCVIILPETYQLIPRKIEVLES